MARTRTELTVKLSLYLNLKLSQAASWFLVGDPGMVSEVSGLSYQMGGENVSPHWRYVVARSEGSLDGWWLQPPTPVCEL